MILLFVRQSLYYLFDYFASSKLEVEETSKIIKNISEACKIQDALFLEEVPEMPGHYVGKNFDLAGFSVGCVEKEKIINGKNIKEGDILIGIESSGPHSNGFSLIRKIMKDSSAKEDELKKLLS